MSATTSFILRHANVLDSAVVDRLNAKA